MIINQEINKIFKPTSAKPYTMPAENSSMVVA